MNWSRSRLVAVCYFLVAAPVTVLVLSALPQHAAHQTAANEIILGIDPVQSKVHWTLESTVHTVHGSFAFKKGNLQVDTSTGKASGEIIVDATSGNSGNDGRDKKMRSEEHTSDLQSRLHLVCRLLLEKKKTNPIHRSTST